MDILEKLQQIDTLDNQVSCVLPERKRIIAIIKLIHCILFPKFYPYSNLSQEEAWIELQQALLYEIRICLQFANQDVSKAQYLTQSFLQQLPQIKELLLKDIQAIYDGDPAAKNKAIVLLCYPGFYAISIYRIAHALYVLQVPYVPRIMSEYAHEKNGIDINPGATIGEYFCIDHGTGIVIGETAVIGHHVKLYQGVTIGAKSFDVDMHGNPIKGGKRHPNIGNHVVIYANATILGGDTTIGDNCVIGGNTWIVKSVEENRKVYYEANKKMY